MLDFLENEEGVVEVGGRWIAGWYVRSYPARIIINDRFHASRPLAFAGTAEPPPARFQKSSALL
jgi:hypothetical protein